MITRYLLVAALIAVTGLGGLLYRETTLRAAVEADNARLSRSVATLTREKKQAAQARDVARAERDRVQAAAKEYEQIKDAFRKGDLDASLPDDFRRLLDRLLHGPR